MLDTSSTHTTNTFSSTAAICGIIEKLRLSLRLIGSPNERPPLLLARMNISLNPESRSSSCQTTYTLSPAAAICVNCGKLVLELGRRFSFSTTKVSPLLWLALKKISFPSSPADSHTIYTLSPTAATCGFEEEKASSFRFKPSEKIKPLSLILEKKTSKVGGTSRKLKSCQTT